MESNLYRKPSVHEWTKNFFFSKLRLKTAHPGIFAHLLCLTGRFLASGWWSTTFSVLVMLVTHTVEST